LADRDIILSKFRGRVLGEKDEEDEKEGGIEMVDNPVLTKNRPFGGFGVQESVRHLSEADAVDLRKQEVPVSKHEKHRARMVEEEVGVKPHVARVTGFKKTTTTAAKGGQSSNILPNDSTTGQKKISNFGNDSTNFLPRSSSHPCILILWLRAAPVQVTVFFEPHRVHKLNDVPVILAVVAECPRNLADAERVHSCSASSIPFLNVKIYGIRVQAVDGVFFAPSEPNE